MLANSTKDRHHIGMIHLLLPTRRPPALLASHTALRGDADGVYGLVTAGDSDDGSREAFAADDSDDSSEKMFAAGDSDDSSEKMFAAGMCQW
jgi:hypothetical protein